MLFDFFVDMVLEKQLSAFVGVLFRVVFKFYACKENLLDVDSVPDTFLGVQIKAPEIT